MKNFAVYAFVLMIYHLRWTNNGITSVTSQNSDQSSLFQFVDMIKNTDNEFWVGKLTPYNGNQNQVIFCGTRTHTAGCGGIKIHFSIEGDTTIVIKTKAYDIQNRHFVLYTGKLYISNGALQETIDQLQIASSKQPPSNVPQPPQSIIDAIASPFKILAVGQGYVLCQAIKSGDNWVLYTSNVVKSKTSQNPSFIEEVNQKCQNFGMQNLKDIDTVFPGATNFIFSDGT